MAKFPYNRREDGLPDKRTVIVDGLLYEQLMLVKKRNKLNSIREVIATLHKLATFSSTLKEKLHIDPSALIEGGGSNGNRRRV